MPTSLSPASAFTDSLGEWTALAPLLPALKPTIDRLGQSMLATWRAGGKIMFAGNGGSAADAMHFAEELTVRFKKDRRALAALALLDPTAVTCAANDMGYDHVFSRQVDALGKPGDLFCGLTTSGNSPNIVAAIAMAKELGVKTCLFSGETGGKLAGQCDIEILVPSRTTARVQEVHKLLFHSLCVWIDEIADTI